MDTLPLYHRLTGQPVIVLGGGEAAEAKRRLVTRAGAEVVDDLQAGIDRGARLAFIAHGSEEEARADAIRAHGAGLLVNVVDRPALCDFTVPSLLERGPVLVAVGTGGVSAGLAKQLRLRLEGLLPASLGLLAERLGAARTALRARFPAAADRRRAIDAALAPGGLLDPLDGASADRVDGWLAGAAAAPAAHHEIRLASGDPDDLTLRAARLLGTADVVAFEPGVAPAILLRARADAVNVPLGVGQGASADLSGTVVILRAPTS
ncbi:siroheme synthase [Novosphingobium flavum]|uniref:precorrin-2 dehydrogenase n=1 Tax=Novosphingobium flavum TaxID=1778672 RepID=A0A7X1FSZ1_9SPHN|nr:bifunctional precorrin-2 dehydrogenase/sirohydrochlorin ferrochelatase [Novosphingobium flavum]MBC2665782.1 siroheme synthase [Novosphingobium flavum]